MNAFNDRQRNSLRLAVAITLSVAIAYFYSWPGSFVMPVFVAVLINAEPRRQTGFEGAVFFVAVSLLLLFGLWLSEFSLQFPLISALLMLCLLWFGQYAAVSGAPAFLVVISFLSILMLPLLATVSPDLVSELVQGLMTCALFAVLCCWLAYGLITGKQGEEAIVESPVLASQHQRMQLSLLRTVLIVPLFIVFYLYQLSSDLLTLIFVALLIQMPSAAIGLKGLSVMVLANAIGGVVAVLMYYLLSISPSPLMLLLLVFVVSLQFGKQIYSGDPKGALFVTGLNTWLVLVGSTTGSPGADAADKMWLRLAQIFAAGIYVVVVLSLAEQWLTKQKTRRGADAPQLI